MTISAQLDEVKQHAAAAAAATPPNIKFVQGGASTQIVFDGSALTVPGYCRQADCDFFATMPASPSITRSRPSSTASRPSSQLSRLTQWRTAA